jgi:hypothetical protein
VEAIGLFEPKRRTVWLAVNILIDRPVPLDQAQQETLNLPGDAARIYHYNSKFDLRPLGGEPQEKPEKTPPCPPPALTDKLSK